jgi:hypothetical protein
VQQQRRDGRSAAKTAFRSLRFLLDNAKMVTAARDALVFKRKFATTVPTPTPSLEPPHYAHLCYLAAHHADRVVRGTAAGFALTASQTSRFKQAQSCAILAEKKGVLYTAVQMDKSNEPHKQSARPAFGPILDAFGTRGVIDAVYDALTDVEAGCFLVRDNDSISGALVDGSSFTNGPILGARADAALQYLLTLPPLKCDPGDRTGLQGALAQADDAPYVVQRQLASACRSCSVTHAASGPLSRCAFSASVMCFRLGVCGFLRLPFGCIDGPASPWACL